MTFVPLTLTMFRQLSSVVKLLSNPVQCEIMAKDAGQRAARRRRAVPPKERHVDPDRTVAALLDSALEEFAAKGFAGARVRDIAGRAGVSKDLIAYHFGNKEGLYRAVQRTWLEREDHFTGPHLPIGELVARYLHDALADPRSMRLMIWRGLARSGDSPPDETQGPADLSTMRDRQAAGELPADIEPASLRLALLALVAAPITFPQMTHKLFGTTTDDASFERRYAADLQRILSHLRDTPKPATKPD